MAANEQRMIEQLYKDLLKVVEDIAAKKGLDMVFEKSEPDLPAANGNDLTLAISTHKLLYSKGCVDITADVISAVDKQK
jgi:Skp family chaperone for outer membrane proteins